LVLMILRRQIKEEVKGCPSTILQFILEIDNNIKLALVIIEL